MGSLESLLLAILSLRSVLTVLPVLAPVSAWIPVARVLWVCGPVRSNLFDGLDGRDAFLLEGDPVGHRVVDVVAHDCTY